MFITHWHLILAFLIAFGFYWCYAVIRRLPDDIQELRQVKEASRRFAIVFVWIATVPIAIAVCCVAYAILTKIAAAFRDLV
jgi:hypothetical protein